MDIFLDKGGSTWCCDSHANRTDVTLHFNDYDTVSMSLRVRDDDVAAYINQGIEEESSVPVSSVAEDNEGHSVGELICEYGSENTGIIAHVTPNTAVNCFRTTTGNTFHTVSTNFETPDGRFIALDKLKAKIREYHDLNEIQRDLLLAVLIKYQPHLTKRARKM